MNSSPDNESLIREQLSAWLDDELPDGQIELLAARMLRAPEHQARLARYSLIGSAMRGAQSPGQIPGPGVELAALSVSSRVRTALGTTGESIPAPGRRRLLPYGLAAAVALLAVALVPVLRPVSLSGSGAAVQADALAPAMDVQPALRPAVAAGQGSLSPGRLTSYLVYHGQYSGTLSARLTDSHIISSPAYAAAEPAVVRTGPP